MSILLLNAGSSSLKADLLDGDSGRSIAAGHADWAGSESRFRYVAADGSEQKDVVNWRSHDEAVRRVLHDLTTRDPIAIASLDQLQAVGHRIVHGGDFQTAVRITLDVQTRLESLADLAPLHNLPSLKVVAAAKELISDVPQIAIFDTMFHATMPQEAYTYPVPNQWTREWGVRRYGFHGLSHAYCSRRAADMLNRPAQGLKLVNCHLGHGCSAAAILDGKSVDTTMGFTPLEGLMMATRSGTIDPAIITFVEQKHGLKAEEVDAVLNRKSGLLGLSGLSPDMREIVSAMQKGHDQARLAFAVYTRRIRQAIGSLAVTLGGIDALIFTAGVGENSPEVRAAVCQGLECLNLIIDENANRSTDSDSDIATKNSTGRILVIHTREDLEMLAQVKTALATT